jgi:hypothetical protein
MEIDRRQHSTTSNPGSIGTDEGDWVQAVALCRAVSDELETLVPGIVTHIRSEVAEYAPVPREEHEYHVGEQFRGLLAGLSSRTPPTPEQTERARELGRQRARQGVPVEAVIGAYHVGYRELWNALLTRAMSDDWGLADRLVLLVNLVWTWVHVVSSASADAHADVMRAHQAVQTSLGHRFLDTLRSGEAASDEAVLLSRSLAFDPEGTFQALCVRATGWPDDHFDRLQRWFDALPGTIHSATRGSFTTILFQGVMATTVLRTVLRSPGSIPTGVGMARPGLAGAESSIVDAERALAMAVNDGSVVQFEDEWLAASLLPQRRRLAPVLDIGRDVAEPHPHLAEAIQAFADNGFSVTASARALHLHPNTVKYRLDRWRELTGWDPRTPDGLVRSLITLKLPF